MARMRPAVCPIGAAPGEREVFRALAEAPGTEQWMVLHSLLLAEHVRQVEGEADFVVIVPEHGVLVIEVKSHRSIDRRSDGTWKLGNDRPTERGPFQQASEAMYSLRNYLEPRMSLRSIPILSAVWFTSVRARTMLPPNPEWHDWQVLDSQDLRSASAAVVRTIAAGTRHLEDKISNFSYGGVGPAPETAERMASLLRPRFELATVAGDRRRAREAQLISFVDEQFLALDAASDNRSVLFSGPAGSGKTFLAMEAARREAAAGSRGRLLCYNSLLGRRLGTDMAGVSGLVVGTLHRELLRLSGLERVPEDAGPEFWTQELPERAMEALLDGGDAVAGDYLVVDEIQDIAIDSYLDVLDLMVRGGLSDGRVLLFGDFERQAIFDNEPGHAVLRDRMPHLPSFKLVQNCRNLPRIGYQVNLLGRLQPGFQQFRRLDDGVDPVVETYSPGQDLSALLVAAIRDLKDDGFALNEIVVLSPRRDDSTAATTADPWLRQILTPADGLSAKPGRVLYSTVHAFKGLDAPAVVVTDLEEGAVAENFDSLLYVGLTRATDRLVALIEAATLRHAIGGSHERT